MLRRLGLVCVCCLLLAGFSRVARGQLESRQWKLGEDTREALIYFPPAPRQRHRLSCSHSMAMVAPCGMRLERLPCTANGPRRSASICRGSIHLDA